MHTWCVMLYFVINILPTSTPSAKYMHQLSGSSLVQVMACCLSSTKPLPEPLLPYCELDSWEQISVKFASEFYDFHSRKCNWKCLLSKWRPFYSGGDESMYSCNPFIYICEASFTETWAFISPSANEIWLKDMNRVIYSIVWTNYYIIS